MKSPVLKLDDFLPFRLSVTSNLVSEAIAQTYITLFGLSIPEWRLIAVIAESDAITQLQIGERTRMDKVTVSRAAIALANRGLVIRTMKADDHRSKVLSLSPAGRVLYSEVVPKALYLESEIFCGIGGDELAALRALLRQIDTIVLSRPTR